MKEAQILSLRNNIIRYEYFMYVIKNKNNIHSFSKV